MGSVTATAYVDTEVDVDLSFEDIVADLDASECLELAELLTEKAGTACVAFGRGDGDVSRIENTIERAYLAARRLGEIPREIADLFWVVHGRAI